MPTSNAYKPVNSCRACGCKQLTPILSLGEQASSDFVTDNQKPIVSPLNLLKCDSCSLVQLEHTVNRDLLYKHYYYRSSTNPVMRAALQDIVDNVKLRVRERKLGEVWVDAGSNDGYLLSCIPPEYHRVGFEPATNLAEECQVGGTIFNDYFNAKRYLTRITKMAKIITAISMFYDLDNPKSFLNNIKVILDQDGLLVIQQNYLPAMLANNAYDNIGSEHLCYYSLTSLKPLVESVGLEIFDVEQNNVNGGSFRVYVGHKGMWPIDATVAKLLNYEESTLNAGAYVSFVQRIEQSREVLLKFLRKQRKDHRKVYALGASNRGNTILQYCGIEPSLLSSIAEVDVNKFGRRTVASNIPIISEQELVKRKPKYLLILPYFYKQHFIVKQNSFLEHGGSLIVPLPEPHLIKKVNGKLVSIPLS